MRSIFFKRKSLQIVVFLMLSRSVIDAHAEMAVTGLVNSDATSIIGSVNVSSMTISSLTVVDMLQVNSSTAELKRGVVQMKCSSTTLALSVTTTTYQPIDILSSTITLNDTRNYVRISLSGVFAVGSAQDASGFITIKRDSIDLGNTVDNSGLSSVTADNGGVFALYTPVGITVVDYPGDTNPHKYQVYIRSSNTMNVVFPANTVGYFLIEEIGR